MHREMGRTAGEAFHPPPTAQNSHTQWSEPLGLDHIAPSQLSRLLGKQGFKFLGGSVAEG